MVYDDERGSYQEVIGQYFIYTNLLSCNFDDKSLLSFDNSRMCLSTVINSF